MGGDPEGGKRPQALIGTDGREYLTLSAASARLGIASDTVGRILDVVPAAGLVEVPRKRGHPVTRVVSADAVEAERRARLSRLRVTEDDVAATAAAEVKELRRTVRALESLCAELTDLYEAAIRSSEAESAERTKLRSIQLDTLRAMVVRRGNSDGD